MTGLLILIDIWGKANKKSDISTQSHKFRSMSTKSTSSQDYNGRLFLLYLLCKIRCTDAKRLYQRVFEQFYSLIKAYQLKLCRYLPSLTQGWVGGPEKRQFSLTLYSENVLTQVGVWLGGSKKPKDTLMLYKNGPVGYFHHQEGSNMSRF